MDDLMTFTQYAFTLCDKLIDTINQSIILQFGVLLVFSYFALSVMKKIISNSDDTDSKGGVSI